MVFGFGKKKAAEVAPERLEEQVIAVEVADDEDEIMVIIAAAVAYLTPGGGVVTTIRRVTAPAAPIWSLVGRQESMNLRQI